MAEQKGIIKLKGTIGNLSFYKSRDGYLAREKGGVDGERIRNDPAFQRTRENGTEFGRAGKAGKVLRQAFRLLIQNASDSKVTSRLMKEMMRVIKTDVTHGRGERTVTNGDLSLLKGFDFNIQGKLTTTLYAQYDTVVDRAAGSMGVQVPAFVPGNTISYPSGATHFKFLVGAAEVDFEAEGFVFNQVVTSGDIELGPQQEAAMELHVPTTAASTLDMFLVLGMDFLQEVNGVMYPLKNGSHNPLTIIAIDEAAG